MFIRDLFVSTGVPEHRGGDVPTDEEPDDRAAEAVYFLRERSVAVRPVTLPELGPEDVRVCTDYSAISPGTERMIYRGEAPTDMPADATLETIPGSLSYPLQYGYAIVGRVDAAGEAVDPALRGRRVFCFHPHQTATVVDREHIAVVPPDIDSRSAALVPFAETAVSIVQDAAPITGDRVVVTGAGTIGSCICRLLAHMGVAEVIVVDPDPQRRRTAANLGATAVRDTVPEDSHPTDIGIEVSGNPTALNQLLETVDFDGQIVVGSWYGRKLATLDLGRWFHRERLTIHSSQVSTVAPRHRGRWDKERRFEAAWDLVRKLPTNRLVTHITPFAEAASAYRRLDEEPTEAGQMLLSYNMTG